MPPRLIASSVHYLLGSEAVTIGRDGSNTIVLEDPTVSSSHCRIESDGDRFVVADGGSTNGTFVNGQEITRKHLEPGDTIKVGQTIFRFLTGEIAEEAVPKVQLDEYDDDGLFSSETVALSPADSIYLKTDLEADAPRIRRLAHDMAVLLKLSAEISEIEDSARLQELLLERVFEVVPADNGAILIASPSGAFLPSPATRQRTAGIEPIRISRTVTQNVLKTGQAMLRNDVLTDEQSPQSLTISRSRSVLCLPLSVMSTRLGVLYLSITISEARFDERHLQLATAIAGIAAVALEHLRYVEWLETENEMLTEEASLHHDMVGQSPKMRELFEKIAQVAPNDSRVLILGETGTGKELVARAIHKSSNRRLGPFVPVNCGAISESLFMSELFGHVKGAFTGAERDRRGFIEEANGGTLFLDEIGDIPANCQAALLRVIEDSILVRVGSTQRIPVDVRLISATSRPLKEAIAEGGFRSDLYFRLGLAITLPPLRERAEDIPLLVRFFVQQHRKRTNRELGPTHPDAIRILQEYSWPGNVRQLDSVILGAVVFGKGDRIRPEDLPAEIAQSPSRVPVAAGQLDDAKASYERQLIVRALEETRGVVSDAAAKLGRVPTYLHRRISQLGLRDELQRIRGG